jgi:hypothetical protein
MTRFEPVALSGSSEVIWATVLDIPLTDHHRPSRPSFLCIDVQVTEGGAGIGWYDDGGAGGGDLRQFVRAAAHRNLDGLAASRLYARDCAQRARQACVREDHRDRMAAPLLSDTRCQVAQGTGRRR